MLSIKITHSLWRDVAKTVWKWAEVVTGEHAMTLESKS